MNITVRYFGQARQAAGVERDVVQVAGDASVADVVRAAVRKRPEGLARLLLSPDGALRQSLLAPVNDEVRDTQAKGGLKENDEVAVFTALSGG